MNMGSILVALVLVLICALIIRKLIKDKKAGISSCGGNCSSCHGCGQGTGHQGHCSRGREEMVIRLK